MVRVGISALTLIPGVVGGSETAYRALLQQFHQHPEIQPRVFLPKIAPDAAEGHAYSVIQSYAASTSTPGRLYAMGSSLALGGRIRREMRLEDLDVLHFPFSTMIPRVTSIPTVTSILDVQHEYLPEFFSKPELAYRKLTYGRSARDSDLVITISEHAKHTLIERLGTPEQRVRVIHLGADLKTFTPSDQAREEFLFYPANRWQHKNHGRLFEAFEILRTTRPDLRLVLTGSGHEGHPVPTGVEVLGRVPLEELVHLYRTAAALVYPSLFEGFGIPIVEAFATNCPVAAGNTSSIPEVAGDAAVLFDPASAESIAEGVERILADPTPYVQRGRERARTFTWETSCQKHIEVYRELAQR
jgi:glycosyltransferase involved in cell wall biosynthesis